MRAPVKHLIVSAVIVAVISSTIVILPAPSEAEGPPSRSMLYGMYTKLSDVDGSFVGEAAGDNAGRIRKAGDVNGDGLKDFLVMAWMNDEGGSDAGQTYLIFGNRTGWAMDDSLANADASFIGEAAGDQCGCRGSDAGDVNGDGYDDFLIPSMYNDENGADAGQAYLILGKSTGWKMDVDLSNADASFWGEYAGDNLGQEVGGGGDVNGDGYDDFIVCATGNDENGNNAGQTYLFLGRSSGWENDINCSKANASFLGETAGDAAGYSADIIDDVNGDGLDEIFIASKLNSEGGTSAGQCYLIFGKRTGWKMDVDLSNADASFWGENANDGTGDVAEGEGDFNGDGYNDLIIGSMNNGDGGAAAGQVYIVFGKATGWSRDTSLANADASFIGEAAGDQAGWGNCLGDVNMDGYDDIVVGAVNSGKGGAGAGQVYVVLGKRTGWKMDTKLSQSAASFYGEAAGDNAGRYDPVGDINGDGAPDLVVGASGNDQGGAEAGQAYVVFLYYPYEPTSVDSVKTYSDPEFLDPMDRCQVGDEIYIVLKGVDSNPNAADLALVNISSTAGLPLGFRYWLKESGANTGVYIGKVRVTSTNDPAKGLIKADIGEYIEIIWTKDISKKASVLVSASVFLTPIRDETRVLEDEDYLVAYENMGFNEATEWEFETNAGWLEWDDRDHILSGSPTNRDVGLYNVRVKISDGLGNEDEHDFNLEVVNAAPSITHVNDIEVMQDERFIIDCDSDDEGIGNTRWSVTPYYSEWMEMNPLTGILRGTPTNDFVGDYRFNISVDDGNKGYNWTEFNLTVIDRNDPPVILTKPTTSVKQGKPYYVQFNAIDEDDVNAFEWGLETEAGFLSLDNRTGVLSGTPTNDDVGTYPVMVSAEDLRGGMAYLNYTLEVVDVNDLPTWKKVPLDSQIDQGEFFGFKVVAEDVDADDTIEYDIASTPISDISIGSESGEIEWVGSLKGLKPTPNYVLNVEISATDGEGTILHQFTITVVPNPSPTSTIMAPADGIRITHEGALLEWRGEDDGEEPLMYDVYLSTSRSAVQNFQQGALFREDLEAASVDTGELEKGTTYYWTVVPKDVFSRGTCVSGILSIVVNAPPVFGELVIPRAKAGTEFRLILEGDDANDDDLEFSLVSGPQGMVLDDVMLTWTPTDEQVGGHRVNVSLYDGYETAYKMLEVEVSQGEVIDEPEGEGGSSVVWIVIIVVILLLLAGAGVGAFLFMKSRKGGEEIKEEPGTSEGGPGQEGVPIQDMREEYQKLYGPGK